MNEEKQEKSKTVSTEETNLEEEQLLFEDDEKDDVLLEKPREAEEKVSIVFPILLVVLVLIAAAAVATLLFWKPWETMSREEKPTIVVEETTEPTEPPTEPYVAEPRDPNAPMVPDLPFFAGQYVRISSIKSEPWADQRIYQVDSEDAAKQIMEEYGHLLESSYPFGALQPFTKANGEGITAQGTCYNYTGTEEISGFRLGIHEQEDQSYHFVLAMYCKEDQWYLWTSSAKAIRFAFDEVRTTFGELAGPVAPVAIPELLSFADGNAQFNVCEVDANQFTTVIYHLPFQSMAEYMVEEYCSLLDEKYAFDLLNVYTTEAEGQYIQRYCYAYTGNMPLDAFIAKVDDQTNTEASHCQVALRQINGAWYIQIKYSSGIYQQIAEEKTTYENTAIATIPDPVVFVGNHARSYDYISNAQGIQYEFDYIPRDAAMHIMDEFGQLLKQNHSFSYIGRYELTEDQWLKTVDCYRYEGEADVVPISVANIGTVHHIRITFWESDSGCSLRFNISGDIQNDDSGIASTYGTVP